MRPSFATCVNLQYSRISYSFFHSTLASYLFSFSFFYYKSFLEGLVFFIRLGAVTFSSFSFPPSTSLLHFLSVSSRAICVTVVGNIIHFLHLCFLHTSVCRALLVNSFCFEYATILSSTSIIVSFNKKRSHINKNSNHNKSNTKNISTTYNDNHNELKRH